MKKIVVAMSFVVLSACAKTGSVTEIKRPEAGLAKYQTVKVETVAQNAELKTYADQMQPIILENLKNAGIFKTVATNNQNADLTLKLNLLDRKGGNKAARLMNMGGETEYKTHATLIEKKTNKEVGAFEVVGNSMRTKRVSVGPYNSAFAATGDNLDKRAQIATGQALVEYLNKLK